MKLGKPLVQARIDTAQLLEPVHATVYVGSARQQFLHFERQPQAVLQQVMRRGVGGIDDPRDFSQGIALAVLDRRPSPHRIGEGRDGRGLVFGKVGVAVEHLVGERARGFRDDTVARRSDFAVDPGDHLAIELGEIRRRACGIGCGPAVGHVDADRIAGRMLRAEDRRGNIVGLLAQLLRLGAASGLVVLVRDPSRGLDAQDIGILLVGHDGFESRSRRVVERLFAGRDLGEEQPGIRLPDVIRVLLVQRYRDIAVLLEISLGLRVIGEVEIILRQVVGAHHHVEMVLAVMGGALAEDERIQFDRPRRRSHDAQHVGVVVGEFPGQAVVVAERFTRQLVIPLGEIGGGGRVAGARHRDRQLVVGEHQFARIFAEVAGEAMGRLQVEGHRFLIFPQARLDHSEYQEEV